MPKINYIKLAAILTSFAFFIPIIIFADNTGSPAATIDNPLGPGNTSVNDLLIKIMKIVATVGAIVVVFFIIYSGFKFVTAGSSDTDRTKAKEMFYATIIGGAILLGADVIATIVVNTVKCTTGKC